jgi:hypothetical protein
MPQNRVSDTITHVILHTINGEVGRGDYSRPIYLAYILNAKVLIVVPIPFVYIIIKNQEDDCF